MNVYFFNWKGSEHVDLAEILDLHLEIRYDSIKNCDGICPMMEPENTTIVNLN